MPVEEAGVPFQKRSEYLVGQEDRGETLRLQQVLLVEKRYGSSRCSPLSFIAI